MGFIDCNCLYFRFFVCRFRGGYVWFRGWESVICDYRVCVLEGRGRRDSEFADGLGRLDSWKGCGRVVFFTGRCFFYGD